MLEVWDFVDGSYLKSVDPSKVVLRTFRRGAPRYNETYDIPVLRRMDELWSIRSRKSVRALLVMVIRLQTLEVNVHLQNQTRGPQLDSRFLQVPGHEGGQEGQIDLVSKEMCIQEPSTPIQMLLHSF